MHTLRQKTFVSSAQIKNVGSIRVNVVPPPGLGRVINVLSAIMASKFGTVPYVANGQFILKQGDFLPIVFGLDVNATTDQYDFVQPPIEVVGNRTQVENVGVDLTVNNIPPGSSPTGGDGTATVIVYYTIEDL